MIAPWLGKLAARVKAEGIVRAPLQLASPLTSFQSVGRGVYMSPTFSPSL